MAADGEEWQLGHRIEEPWGQTPTWWESHPVTVVRPASGEITARFLCATCDEPVECVVSAPAVDRRRSRLARAAAACGVAVLGVSAVGYLLGAITLAVSLEWWPTVALVPAAALCGWLAAVAVPFTREREMPADQGVRLAAPSPSHELKPPSLDRSVRPHLE